MKTDQPMNEGVTAEEFYKSKFRDLHKMTQDFSLAIQSVNLETAMRWAHEYASSKLKEKDEEIKVWKLTVDNFQSKLNGAELQIKVLTDSKNIATEKWEEACRQLQASNEMSERLYKAINEIRELYIKGAEPIQFNVVANLALTEYEQYKK